MIIHRLYIQGFKIIGEPINLEFPEEGRIGIFGGNESGKSTLLESVEYALYGLGKGAEVAKEDVVTWGKERAKLLLEFTSGAERYLIEREIGLKTGHKARLHQITGGSKSTPITSLTKIGEEIERITGMDRDSFTKLVYIKQKDLDALKELTRSSREQLINKVMGMEAFDEADKKLQADLKETIDELQKRLEELRNVERDKRLYEEKTARKTDLEAENQILEPQLSAAAKELEEKRVLLQRYEWLGKLRLRENALREKEREAKRLEQDLKILEKSRREIEVLTVKLRDYEGIEEKLDTLRGITNSQVLLEKVLQEESTLKQRMAETKQRVEEGRALLKVTEPEHNSLSENLPRYLSLERAIDELTEELETREFSQKAEMERLGLTGYSPKTLANLGEIKGLYLKLSITSLIIGMLLIIAASLSTSLILFIAVACLLYSAYLFTRYSKFEKLSSSIVSIQSDLLETQRIRERLEGAKKELDKLREETKLPSSKEIEEKLAVIKLKIKESTGQDSLEGLRLSVKNDENSLLEMERGILELSTETAKHREAIEEGKKRVQVEENIQEQIKRFEELRDEKNQVLERKRNEEEKANEIEARSPGENLEKVKKEIDDINRELEELEKTRPDKAQEVTYSEEGHDKAKEEASKALDHHNSLKNTLDGNLREIKTLDADLAQLKPSKENYPALKEKIAELKARTALMERTRQEIKETSRQLRNTVIPHARYIINDILPTITDGRYTDLQISEDLKFQAHSTEAGGYKEQVIFSGGTQDQFLIALRLAFTASILDSRVRADSYSLLMDECISSSDEGRRKGIFDVLEAMKKTFRQIFIIAHEDITENVDYYITMVRNERGYSQIRSKSW